VKNVLDELEDEMRCRGVDSGMKSALRLCYLVRSVCTVPATVSKLSALSDYEFLTDIK